MGSDDLGVPGLGQEGAARTAAGWPRSRLVAVAAWILAFALWTVVRSWPYLSALLFVLLGATALLSTAVSAWGWRAATWRTARFPEAAARSAWTAGGVGTIVFFQAALFGPSEGLAIGAHRLAVSFLPALFGGALVAGLLARMLRAVPEESLAPSQERLAGQAWDLWMGRCLFVVLVVWPLVQARWLSEGSPLVDSVWTLHWPAVLVLLGTTAALHVVGGAAAREGAASALLAGAGTLTALAGLVQALLGMARADITGVATGLSFLVTTCLVTLLGLALVTFPRDDRRPRPDTAGGAAVAARGAWLLFPLLTVILLAVTFILIMTPMARRL